MLDSRYRDKSGRRPLPPYVRKLETDARKVMLDVYYTAKRRANILQRLNADKMITDDCPYYETPNMVEELSAAIITYVSLPVYQKGSGTNQPSVVPIT